ncbi:MULTISPECIES: SDR family NAD(P)-dependent oxidoreductase [unclassified Amycolatopsis]|uniref:SDR family NAD(P)-dependent oxidoreductase n=1 Tax=Amycolatopsis TaxID=1813 RepID=UPI00026269F3|nr:SDR family NAD(P)-dependent oxidoreductase [Amycolatopsis sp. ATCC 39116]
MTDDAMDFAGRVVVVTGASRGIGSELARAFAQRGARLGLLARDIGALKRLADDLPTEVTTFGCDVSDPAETDTAIKGVAEQFGRIDSVVANAGVSLPSHRAHKLSDDVWRRVIDVNLTGTFNTARAAHAHLAATGRGRLVLTSSIMARVPRRGLSAYVASKAGIEGLTRALAVDWAVDGILVNAVAPGFFDIGLGSAFGSDERLRTQVLAKTPQGRLGSIEELANVVMYLSGARCGYLTGEVLTVSGGYGLG